MLSDVWAHYVSNYTRDNVSNQTSNNTQWKSSTICWPLSLSTPYINAWTFRHLTPHKRVCLQPITASSVCPTGSYSLSGEVSCSLVSHRTFHVHVGMSAWCKSFSMYVCDVCTYVCMSLWRISSYLHVFVLCS